MKEFAMVMEKARPRLNKLAKLAPQLNEATDRYMDELKAIEAELQKMNLGIPVELGTPFKQSDYKASSGGRYYDAWFLGYDRMGPSGWGFVVRLYEVQGNPESIQGKEYEEKDITPLLAASRELRLAAAEQIPTLLDLLEERATEKLEALKEVSDR